MITGLSVAHVAQESLLPDGKYVILGEAELTSQVIISQWHRTVRMSSTEIIWTSLICIGAQLLAQRYQ